MDEVHHCPASTFEKVLVHSFAGIKLGLSGTLHRKDGKHVLFKGWFGDNVITPIEENVMIPSVKRVFSRQPFNPSAAPGGWANAVTELYQNQSYLMEVVALQTRAYFGGHVPLITSDRVDFSKKLKELLDQTSDKPWALVIAGEKDRSSILNDVRAGKYAGIISTTSIFSEGLSVNNLSCVIPTSTSDNMSLIRQIIGRVQRHSPGKKDPIVIDLALTGATGYRHAEARAKIYLDRKFPLKVYKDIELLSDSLSDLK